MPKFESTAPPTRAPLLVVVSFERFAASALGAYGNQWVESPCIDRLVMEGALFERLISHDPDLGTVPEWWTRGLQLLEDCTQSELSHSARLIVERESQFAARSLQEKNFASLQKNVEFVDGQEGLDVAPSEFPFSRLMAQGVEWLRQQASCVPESQNSTRVDPLESPQFAPWESPQWLWLHSRGIPKPWLPPRELADLYFSDFEDQGWALEEIDSSEWGELWPVYGSYASLIDHALGTLIDELRKLAATRPVQLLLFAAAGELIESIHPGSDRIHGLEVMSFRPPLIYWESGLEMDVEKHPAEPAAGYPVRAEHPAILPAGSRWKQLLNDIDIAAKIEKFWRRDSKLSSLFDDVLENVPGRDFVVWHATARQWKAVVTSDFVYVSTYSEEDSQRSKNNVVNSSRDQFVDPGSDATRRPLDTERERLHLLPDDPWLLLNEAAQSQDLVFEMRQILEGGLTSPLDRTANE